MGVANTFTVVSGTYTDEQGLMSSLDSFMTGTISGWTQLKIITDIASDKHIAYTSIGEGTRDVNTVSIRATTDYLEFHCYSLFNTSTDVGSDDLYNTETRIPTSTSSGTYWFFGNRDSVYVSVQHADTSNKHLGGLGQWVSYYSAQEDPKPYFVFGQSSATLLFDNATERVRSWGPGSFGSSYSELSVGTSVSGIVRNYRAAHNESIKYGVSQVRTSQPFLFAPVFVSIETFPYLESRGEIPGLSLIGITPYSNGNIITISGINLINGTYFIQTHNNSSVVGWALGKVFYP